MLIEGMKIHLILRENPKQSKKKDVHLNGKIETINDNYVLIQTKNYKTCISVVDFETGHAVVSF